MLLVLLVFTALPCVFPSNLPELTNDDFDVKVKEKQFTLVMFYAPWCGHCKRLKPDFISAGEALIDNKNVGFALVDCTVQDKICSRFEVSGYPTLKFFKDGEFYMEYDGARDKSGLLNFALSRSQPPSQLLESRDQFDELINSNYAKRDPVVIAFTSSDTDKLFEVHTNVASDLLGQLTLRHAHKSEVLGDNLQKSFIRVYRPRNLVNKMTEAYVDYTGSLDAPSLRAWIIHEGYGPVAYRHQNNHKLFPSDNILIFYHNDSIDMHPKGVNYHRNRLIKAVKESNIKKDRLLFVYCYSEEFHHELNDLRSVEDSLPIVIIKSAGKKYKMKEYSPRNLVEFLNSFESGTLEPYVKSEPVPIDQPSAAMKVVGHTFDSVVNDATKDVFIMFHAPWCGHCKQLMPTFEKVAEKLKDEPGLRLVTYDATSNDVPEPYEVHGFPTLYFVPKSSKHHPKRYEGSRAEEDLLTYIAKESSDELQGFNRDGTVKKSEL